MQYQLKFSGKHFKELQQHLFPIDGKEAVAIVLCGRFEKDGLSILLTHKIEFIPHNECTRDKNFVQWKTERIIPLLEIAEHQHLSILKIHSHPDGKATFSKTDDTSDVDLFESIFGWCGKTGIHGSAVMLPDGEIFGRIFTPSLDQFPFTKISIAGDFIKIVSNSFKNKSSEEFSLRTIQTFGEGTYSKLKEMKIGVVGCSGTGSPTIEQLVRLGVGNIVIIDPDIIEKKNLNRILNSTMRDALCNRSKVETLATAIEGFGLETVVMPYATNLFNSRNALNELITCDAIFGCLDSVDGRHLLSQLTNFYLIPYFDIGVRLDADGNGGIENIVASVHYIQPGCSTLFSRKLYTSERLFSDSLLRQDPAEFTKREKNGYVHNANVDRPAVISINMQISSMAVIEFLNRLHTFKEESQRNYAQVMIDYCGGCILNFKEDIFIQDKNSEKWAGRGDCLPFLRMPELQLQY